MGNVVTLDRSRAPDPTRSEVTICVLGPIRAAVGGVAVPLGGPRQRMVLAVAVAAHPHRVSVGQAAAAIYGDEATRGCVRTVQTFVSNLRSMLGSSLALDQGWLSLDSTVVVDAHVFGSLVESARTARSVIQQRSLLDQALALWKGDPFHGAESEALIPDIERLLEMQLWAFAKRHEIDVNLGLAEQTIPELRKLVLAHPFRDDLCELLMIAQARAGRRHEALATYRGVAARLRDELGVEPSLRLRQTRHSIESELPLAASIVD